MNRNWKGILLIEEKLQQRKETVMRMINYLVAILETLESITLGEGNNPRRTSGKQ